MQSAANIGKEIKETTDRLTKLSECASPTFCRSLSSVHTIFTTVRGAVARRRSLFDDPADEIKQLTDIIKKRITHLSAEVNDLRVSRASGIAS
jgi:hypothetical protein